MPPIEAIVFDLDDTLYAERHFALSGFRAVAMAFESLLGNPIHTENDLRRLFDGDQRSRVFNALLSERGRPTDSTLIAGMVQTYRNHIPTISLFPDANAALARLAGGHRLGLLTDGPQMTQRNKVNALGLANRLNAILYTDELGPGLGKPNVLPFTIVAERLASPNERCVYVADNPAKDFVGPNALGWRTIRVLRPGGIYAATPVAPGGLPGATISNLDQLDHLLDA